MTYNRNPANRLNNRQPDVMKGAAAIAAFLFGESARRREVYYLVERASLPVFKLGAMICARRSTLESWITAQERGGTVR